MHQREHSVIESWLIDLFYVTTITVASFLVSGTCNSVRSLLHEGCQPIPIPGELLFVIVDSSICLDLLSRGLLRRKDLERFPSPRQAA